MSLNREMVLRHHKSCTVRWHTLRQNYGKIYSWKYTYATYLQECNKLDDAPSESRGIRFHQNKLSFVDHQKSTQTPKR